MYWEKSPACSCVMFKEWGSWRYFEELLSIITLPVYGPDDDRYVQGSGYNDVRKWYDLVAEYLRASYRAGTILTKDETMVFWTGVGVHLTFLPRKPTPVGVMLKTIGHKITVLVTSLRCW
jgi:hypothetical protein